MELQVSLSASVKKICDINGPCNDSPKISHASLGRYLPGAFLLPCARVGFLVKIAVMTGSHLKSSRNMPVPIRWVLIRDQLVVLQKWITWDIAVEGIDMQNGLNEIVIRWPIPTSPGKQGIEAALAGILQGVTPEFYCIFGEIHFLLPRRWGAKFRLYVTLSPDYSRPPPISLPISLIPGAATKNRRK
jgi:hypothetical protein